LDDDKINEPVRPLERNCWQSVRQKHRDSSWIVKGKILDGFVAATGYDRKHAIQLMNSTAEPEKPKERLARQKYDEQTRQAL